MHDSRMEMREFLGALQVLPPDQREALVLVGASGLSYEEAAEVLGTRVGTVKSRVSRGRARLVAAPVRGRGLRARRRGGDEVDGAPAAGAVRVRPQVGWPAGLTKPGYRRFASADHASTGHDVDRVLGRLLSGDAEHRP